MTKIRETGSLTFEEAIDLANKVGIEEWKSLKNNYDRYDKSTQFLRENPKERVYFPIDSFRATTQTDPRYKMTVTLTYTYSINAGYTFRSSSISELFTGFLEVVMLPENKRLYEGCYQERRPEYGKLYDSNLVKIIELHRKIEPWRRT